MSVLTTEAVRDRPVARKRTEKRPTINVAIDEDVVRTARVVSALVERPMSEIISAILRPVLEKMEAEEMAKRTAGRTGSSKPKGGTKA